MKVSELLTNFEIFTTNEETKVLEKLESLTPLHNFPERQRFVIENLSKKSLVSKIMHGKQVMVLRNDIPESP